MGLSRARLPSSGPGLSGPALSELRIDLGHAALDLPDLLEKPRLFLFQALPPEDQGLVPDLELSRRVVLERLRLRLGLDRRVHAPSARQQPEVFFAYQDPVPVAVTARTRIVREQTAPGAAAALQVSHQAPRILM